MRQLIIAGVRTAVQALVGIVVAYLLKLGVEIDAVALESVLLSGVVGLVTIGLNFLQTKFPIVGRILSFGLSASGPSYE